MDDEYPYQKEWEDYRKKSSQTLWIWFVGLPIFWTTIFFVKNFSENFIWLPITIILSVIIIVGWFSTRVTEWKCPRCGENYRNKMLFAQIIATDCRKCGLVKYEGSTFKTY